MKTRWFLSACLTILLAAPRASAAPLYHVTDLGGGGVSFTTDASGHASEVTSLATGAAYAFDKTPVTQIDVRSGGSPHAGSYGALTMQAGEYKVGYKFDYGGSLPDGWGPYFFPAGLGVNMGWSSTDSGLVKDLNIQGQVVGYLSDRTARVEGQYPRYAAFSKVGLGERTDMDSYKLDNYIPPIPGVSLTAATAIDDLGRILATGSDGDTYLLTPTALGPALPVPEPTMLMFFGATLACLGSRRAARSLIRPSR